MTNIEQLPPLYKEHFVTFLCDGGSYMVGGFSDIKMEMIGRFLAEDVDSDIESYERLLAEYKGVCGETYFIGVNSEDMIYLTGENEKNDYIEFTKDQYSKLFDSWGIIIKNRRKIISLLKRDNEYVFQIEPDAMEGIFQEGKIILIKDERFKYKLSVYTDRTMLVLWDVIIKDTISIDLKDKLIDGKTYEKTYLDFCKVTLTNDLAFLRYKSDYWFDSFPCIVKRECLFDLINAYQECKKENKASAFIVHKDQYDVSWELVP